MALQALGTGVVSTACDANLVGAVLVCGYAYLFGAAGAYVMGAGNLASSDPYWYISISTRVRFFYQRASGPATSFNSPDGGIPGGWSWFCMGIDSVGNYIGDYEALPLSTYSQNSGVIGSPKTGAPTAASKYRIGGLPPTGNSANCQFADIRVYQLGAGALPDANTRQRLCFSRGHMRLIPGLGLPVSHVQLIGKNGTDTSTIVPIDLTGRIWTSTSTPYTWVDAPIPRDHRLRLRP